MKHRMCNMRHLHWVTLLVAPVVALSCRSQVEGDFDFPNLVIEAQPPALVSVSFRLLVAETGEPEPYLQLQDFELLEDNAPISPTESQVQLVQRARAFKQEAVIMLDFSASVVRGDFDAVINAASRLATKLSETSAVAVYYFDGRVSPTQIATFSDPDPDLKIESFRDHDLIDSSTNLRGAITSGLTILDERQRNHEKIDGLDPNLYSGSLVIFTDGTHNAGETGGYPSERTTLNTVDRSPHALFTVGVEGEVNINFLETIGRDGFELVNPNGNLEDAFSRLSTTFANFANSFYTIAYCSPSRAGEHSFSIRIKERRNLRGEAILHFDADGFSAGCDESLIDKRFPPK
ncbi:MAG: VWA domain-containing protein [Myxococcales bacterium]|nr:VWA domain-containing protein [Myxococcales bacterium]